MRYISALVGITCLSWALQGNAEMPNQTTVAVKSLPAAGLSPVHTGKTMNQVVQLLGEPDRKTPAVGQPPITRWHYSSHTVYFEKNRVIHAVQH